MNREIAASRVLPAMACAIPLAAAIAPNGLAVVLAISGIALAVSDPQARALGGISRQLIFLVAALLGWAVISLSWAPSAADGADGIVRTAAAAYLGLVTLSRAKRTSLRERTQAMQWFLAAYLAALILLGVQIVSSEMLGPENSPYVILHGYEARNEAFYNRTKTVLTILLPIAAYISVTRHGWHLGLTVIVGCTFVAVIGESMASAVSLAVIAVGYLVGVALRGEIWWKITSAIATVIVVIVPIFASLDVLVRMSQRTDITVSIFHRAGIWSFVSRHIAERPIFGWGMHASRRMPGSHEHFRSGAEWLPLHPHNAPLQVWLELGAVGAITFACIVALALLSCRRGRWNAGVAMSTFAATFFVANVSYGLWQGWWFSTLWLVPAVATLALSSTDPAMARNAGSAPFRSIEVTT